MIEFQVNELNCLRCAATITRAVQSLDQTATVEIDLAAKRVRVESPVGPAKLAGAIRGAGFTPTAD